MDNQDLDKTEGSTEPIEDIKQDAKGTKKKKSAAKKVKKLNLKQEEFCKLYAGDDRDFFGNGVRSYLEVYGYKDDRHGRRIGYETAKSNAYRLLTNAHIVERINSLLESGGFNDRNVDKHHLFLINQFGDLKTKLGAVKEYNVLKKRITKKVEMDVKGIGQILDDLDD